MRTTPDRPREHRPARRGRRPVSGLPEEREKHVSALLAYQRGLSVDQVAALQQVSRRTVYYWIRRALGYDDPRVDDARRRAFV